MSSLVSSVGNMVETGVKGLIGLAENYYNSEDEGEEGTPRRPLNNGEQKEEKAQTGVQPVPIQSPSRDRDQDQGHERHSTSAATAYSTSPSTTASSSIVSKPIVPQGSLVQILDVPSGWIHLQSTYLDGAGVRRVRSFGLKNLADTEVEVTVGSDLDNQILFWISDDEKATSSSSSSVSSVSNNPGTAKLNLNVPALSTITVHLSFHPSKSQADSPPRLPSPSPSDNGGFTPRLQAAASQPPSLDVSPVPSISKASSEQSVSSGGGSASGHSNLSVAGSNSNRALATSSTSTTTSKRPEPIHRAFSVHGSISIHASEAFGDVETPHGLAPSTPTSTQMLTLPFFATVCRSLFTAALIDPSTGLASGSQLSSGQLLIDFGGDPVVGNEYHRDILLVNRSEIELVWSTAVVNSRSKDSVWFSLRDLDSENVFGVDHSSQPVPLPALSSRHLRLELRVKAPISEFDFDFVLSNVHQSGNTVTCRAVGSGQAEGTDDSLKIVSGHTLDFGEVHDGVWAKKMVTCKNAGDRPLDVSFSATQGYDVVFRLAGVAGDDMDEDLSLERKSRAADKAAAADGGTISKPVTETSRGKDYVASLRSSRPSSPSRSREPSSAHEESSSNGLAVSEMLHKWTASRSEVSHGGGSSAGASSGRDASRPPSRALSRVASRTSSYLYPSSGVDSEDEEEVEPPFFGGDSSAAAGGSQSGSAIIVKPSLERNDTAGDKNVPNQIEEITMRPGTEYRIFVLYRPARDTVNPAETAGALRPSAFKVYLESAPSGSRLASAPRFKRTLSCTAESCTSLISLSSGSKVDFGEVTVGASKSSTLSITNLSALSAKVEIAAISKVLNTNRNVIIIPPHETVEEKIEFFPRRINDKYEKQIFVRNLLNRSNDQLVEIKSKNVDTFNLTLHSHLYRILTPSGSNFLDFASVVINSPTVRTVVFENLCQQSLLLELAASQPEDVELFVKAEDAPVSTLSAGKYAAEHANLTRVTSPPNGELKERFMETMRELSGRDPVGTKPSKGKGKVREKGGAPKAADETTPKQSVGAAIASALRKGGRGRPVQLYGNAVVFKDRNLLESHEYLDLAAGPPVSAHRTSPRSKKFQLLDSIEYEDKSKLSGQHPKVPKLDFAAGAKATGLHRNKDKDGKPKKSKSPAPPATASTSTAQTALPSTPTTKLKMDAEQNTPTAATVSTIGAIAKLLLPDGDSAKSPALTAKRAEAKTDVSSSTDVSKMTVDELLVAIEQHDSSRASITHSTLDEEEQYVRRSTSLRKELGNLTSSGKLVSAGNISVPPGASRQLIVVMTPNGSTRPHITTRAKRADSRIYIKLLDFDRSKLSNATMDLADLPVRDLIIRSSCVRSVLEVQQRSINFGTCEKGEVKSKTIVIHNKSDAVGLFRLRTSGSIASGDLKLGLGRYGVISAFGRKEVENFSFTPSLTGTYNENIVVENVLDGFNDQNVAVKANVRKAPTFTVEPPLIDFGSVDTTSNTPLEKMGFTLTNVSKHERTFVVEIKSPSPAQEGDDRDRFVDLSLSRDEVGQALSKTEEEEIENILQKLKIAKRKGKKDKISKYKARLAELGVQAPAEGHADASDVEDGAADEAVSEAPTSAATANTDAEGAAPSTSSAGAAVNDGPRSVPDSQDPPSGSQTPAVEVDAPEYGPKHRVSILTVVLQPNQKNRILVELIPRSPLSSSSSPSASLPSSNNPLSNTSLEAVLQVHDKKNADESQAVKVVARRSAGSATGTNMSINGGAADASTGNTNNDTSSSQPTAALPLSEDPLHLALMRHCLQLTHQCPVSPTAFCVGSCLFLSASSPLFSRLSPFFQPFTADPDSSSPSGLILSDGYSREIPGNTHAEANALTNLQSRLLQLHSSAEGRDLPPANEIFAHVDCYATMEPCSIRTSGGPSCATELVKAGVRRVWLGVEEPPDFVQCDGVNILLQGGVEVGRTTGLEEQCLKAARRGRD